MGAGPVVTPAKDWTRYWPLALAVVILLGAGLRLIWGADIEYKDDEAWMFLHTRQVGRTEPLPWVGQPSSVKVCNPGTSVWVFACLSWLTGADDPVALTRAVEVANVLALPLVVLFAYCVVSAKEREPWLWAAALVSVCPMTVLVHRKLWNPSIYPLFTLALLTCWWYRERRWGAFGWGLIGAFLGQIHMSGFFFAGGFVVWAFLFDRRGVRWVSWFCGSCLASLPLIPWLRSVAADLGHPSGTSRSWVHLLEFRFWVRWVSEPFGLGLDYSLGEDYAQFLGYPQIAGQPTYLVGIAHGAIVLTGIWILMRAGLRLRETGLHWLRQGTDRNSPTAFTQNAALWGFGILLTLSSAHIQRHYLIILFPLTFVWLARLALSAPTGRSKPLVSGRALLVTLCLCEFFVSAGFLGYIHRNQREIRGDYGTPYGAQRKATPSAPDGTSS